MTFQDLFFVLSNNVKQFNKCHTGKAKTIVHSGNEIQLTCVCVYWFLFILKNNQNFYVFLFDFKLVKLIDPVVLLVFQLFRNLKIKLIVTLVWLMITE